MDYKPAKQASLLENRNSCSAALVTDYPKRAKIQEGEQIEHWLNEVRNSLPEEKPALKYYFESINQFNAQINPSHLSKLVCNPGSLQITAGHFKSLCTIFVLKKINHNLSCYSCYFYHFIENICNINVYLT